MDERTPREQNELFEDSFHLWLEENGVVFSSIILPNQYFVKLDINKLKLGMLQREKFLERNFHKKRRVARKKEAEKIAKRSHYTHSPVMAKYHESILGDSGNEAERLNDY